MNKIYCVIISLLLFLNMSCSTGIYSARKDRPNEIGAIAESSARLAKVMVQKIPKVSPSKKILEVGAGTGVFTEKIIEKMAPTDIVDVIELVPELCKILEDKFGANTQVNVVCGDILAFNPTYKYDYIVLGLPFNSFPASLVKNITDHVVDLAKDGAPLSFFEYKWLPTIRPWFMKDLEKENYLKTRAEITKFVDTYQIYQESVYLNLPPAVAHILQINKK